ncbi:hypothetical protein QJS66_02755 [Kocuria rhizophila]|nr:hypothetical protein QJS66_02755 [Kocuria rhizophila]
MLEVANGSNVILATPTGSGSPPWPWPRLRGWPTASAPLHRPHQGARVREVLRPLRDLRGGERGHGHRGTTAMNADAPIVCAPRRS